jgi:perosamine synthetase
VDVEPATLCLDFSLVRKAITPRTKAVMLVSANGRGPAAGVDAFRSLTGELGLALIEDAAQSLGSRYPDGLHIGRVGKVGSVSFSAPKIISTGQGGALITDDDEIASRLRRLKDFGRSGGGNDIHDSIGYNFKFTDLQACVGIEQMKKLPARVARKKRIWESYRDLLAGVPEIRLFDHDLRHTTPWFIDCLAERREALMKFLEERRIGSRVMYPPINRQKAYGLPGSYPVSEGVGRDGLWLPSSNQLSDEEIRRACRAIREFYGHPG